MKGLSADLRYSAASDPVNLKQKAAIGAFVQIERSLEKGTVPPGM
jgi:hypothetical protein